MDPGSFWSFSLIHSVRSIQNFFPNEIHFSIKILADFEIYVFCIARF